MSYHHRDFYFRQAKTENYAARSIYKLREIDEKYRLIRRTSKVLDLGAAPGSWSQYCSQVVGNSGRVVGIDLQAIHLTLPNTQFIVADIRNRDFLAQIEPFQNQLAFDVILSDMAPHTTGIRITDHARSLELAELALGVCKEFLRVGGHFVCKLFQGEDFAVFRKLIKNNFRKLEIFRPKSTRKESIEIYFIGMEKVGQTG